ncbi:MAG TPA: hypothetical protein VIN93_05770 [Bryobacteraceae bacterium]
MGMVKSSFSDYAGFARAAILSAILSRPSKTKHWHLVVESGTTEEGISA